MLYLTCTTITSVDLAHNGVSHAKDWESVDCGTNYGEYCEMLQIRHRLKMLEISTEQHLALKWSL